jgi:hypothetical protein
LLSAAVGPDDEQLQLYRTHPVVVTVTVADLLDDAGAVQPYWEAAAELDRRIDELGLPAEGLVDDDEEPVTTGQLAQLAELRRLQDRLEELRLADWGGYADALTESLRAAAAARGMPLGHLQVTVDLDPYPRLPGLRTDRRVTVADELLVHAVDTTPLVLADRPPPLDRIQRGDRGAGGLPHTTAGRTADTTRPPATWPGVPTGDGPNRGWHR